MFNAKKPRAKREFLYKALFTACIVAISGISIGNYSPAFAEVPGYVTINQGAPNYDLDLDCSSLDGSVNDITQAPNVSLNVNLTNCADISILQIDPAFDPAEPGGVSADGAARIDASSTAAPIAASSQLEIFPNTEVTFADSTSNTYVLSFWATDTVADPSGVLLKTADITIASDGSADQMAIPDQGANFDQDGNGTYWLNGDSNCALLPYDHAYSTYEVTVAQNDDYTFRFVQTSPQDPYLFTNDFLLSESLLDDPYLAVYETANFDPNDPDAGVVGCNDDGNLGDPYVTSTGFVGGFTYSEFTASLTAGTSYTLVLSTFVDQDASVFQSSGYDQTGTFELWGPQGGFGTDIAPYSQSVTGNVGVAITDTDPYVPTGFAGSVTYSISPALPNGMSIDPATGVISGTPTVELATQTFIVTGSDGTDASSAIVSIEVQAAPSPATYTVTFDSQGGSSVSDSSFTGGGSFNLPQAPTKSGYIFNGWFTSPTGGTALSSPYSPSGTSNITLYAHWTADTSGGGSGGSGSGDSSTSSLPTTGSSAGRLIAVTTILFVGGLSLMTFAAMRRRKE